MLSTGNATPYHTSRSKGLIVERYPRNLTIFRPLDNHRTTVDALVEAFHAHDRTAHAETGHARCIIDLRVSGWPTPYSLSVFVFDSAQNTPVGLNESFAFLMADGFAARMMSVMLKEFIPRVVESSRIFFDENQAWQWLQEREEALARTCRAND